MTAQQTHSTVIGNELLSVCPSLQCNSKKQRFRNTMPDNSGSAKIARHNNDRQIISNDNTL